MDDPTATDQAGWFTRTYQYSASIPHAVTSVNPETGSPDTYSYDANGNMTCRIEGGVTYTHTYNAENRASSIAKRSGDCATGTILESWSFVYDGDGVRVGTVHFTGTSGTPDSTTSHYMGGAYELKDGAVKKYYSIAGMMVAVNDGTGLQYLLTDHLGSTVAVTNSSGTLTSQQRYLPFGEERAIPNSPILGTDFTYTGQRKLDDGMGGIMDYKARFYSPYINRFLQPDSIIPDQFNPQSWNRYSYVGNNPIRYIDPLGYWPDIPNPLCCGPDNIHCGGLYGEGSLWDQFQNHTCPTTVCNYPGRTYEITIVLDAKEKIQEISDVLKKAPQKIVEQIPVEIEDLPFDPMEDFPKIPIKILPKFNGGGSGGPAFEPFLVD